MRRIHPVRLRWPAPNRVWHCLRSRRSSVGAAPAIDLPSGIRNRTLASPSIRHTSPVRRLPRVPICTALPASPRSSPRTIAGRPPRTSTSHSGMNDPASRRGAKRARTRKPGDKDGCNPKSHQTPPTQPRLRPSIPAVVGGMSSPCSLRSSSSSLSLAQCCIEKQTGSARLVSNLSFRPFRRRDRVRRLLRREPQVGHIRRRPPWK